MKVEIQNKKINQIKADYELVLTINKNLKHKWVRDQKFLQAQNFKGAAEEVCHLPHVNKLYVGVDSMDYENLRIAISQAVAALKKLKVKSVKIGLYYEKEYRNGAKALAEGFILGLYSFQQYKSKKQKITLNKLIISTETYNKDKIDLSVLKAAVNQAVKIALATNYTRDIVNQIPAEITPVKMSELAKELAGDTKLSVKVYGEKYIEQAGMGAFLAVSKASPYPPQLIHLIHKPKTAKTKIALIGKGLTYDSGGLNVKPDPFMSTMKSDKSGASAILGIMKAVDGLNLPLEVHGIIGATENVIGKHAYKPDDVLIAKNGKTIEVKNTDAEGRLVLADCLVYAQEQKCDYYIDLATLTGACIVALGEYTIGVMGYNQKLKDEIRSAGENSGELTGNLPFNRYLSKLLKSEIADIANLGAGRWGGAITAALFLSEFIEDKNKNKWVHLDIAGPAFVEKPWGYNPHGASGAGVRIVVEWMKSLL